MNELLSILAPVANAILLVALPSLVISATVAVLAWAKKQIGALSKESPDLAVELAYYARIAVESAEQAGAANLISDKRRYAVQVVQGWLDTAGLGAINVALIEAEIERQVYAMKRDGAHFVLPDGE
jgi:hypothetical protein